MERCDGGNKACVRVMSEILTMPLERLTALIEGNLGYPFTDAELDALINEWNHRVNPDLFPRP
jgi:hypothetical protein